MAKNRFNLSHDKKLSATFGNLYPVLVEECLPGDDFKNINQEIMVHVAPLVRPTMHQMDVFIHTFFVPNRILWDEWEDFITGGPKGDKNPQHPYISYDDSNKSYFVNKQLADYMGFPVADTEPGSITGSKPINALPFKAYQKIYNDYYADEDLNDEIDFGYTISGDNETVLAQLMTMRNRHHQKNYLTSARPTAQKGQPVSFIGTTSAGGGYDSTYLKMESNDGTIGDVSLGADDYLYVGASDTWAKRIKLAEAQTTIESLRKAEAMQSYLEALQRSGTRYIEWLKGIFGVRSSDHRLQRAEYIGGGRQSIKVSEVLTTANTGDQTGSQTELWGVTGDYTGHGIAVGQDFRAKWRCEEHGWIMSIMSIVPKFEQFSGLARKFTRMDRFDYYLPHFALVGEQPIRNEEVSLNRSVLDNGANEDTFGYQQRYGEYKMANENNNVHGELRLASENVWHLAHYWGNSTVLNASFSEVYPGRYGRIFTYTDVVQNDPFWIWIHNQVDAYRSIPYLNIPNL